MEPSEAPVPPSISFGWRMMLGFVGYALVCGLLVALPMTTPVPAAAAAAAWFAATIGLFSLALYVRFRHGFSGVGYGMLLAMLTAGVLIVVGVALLIAGICFVKVPFRFN